MECVVSLPLALMVCSMALMILLRASWLTQELIKDIHQNEALMNVYHEFDQAIKGAGQIGDHRISELSMGNRLMPSWGDVMSQGLVIGSKSKPNSSTLTSYGAYPVSSVLTPKRWYVYSHEKGYAFYFSKGKQAPILWNKDEPIYKLFHQTYYIGDSKRRTRNNDIIYSLYRSDDNGGSVECVQGVTDLQIKRFPGSALLEIRFCIQEGLYFQKRKETNSQCNVAYWHYTG